MITLFKEITTEEALQEIEKESEKWADLYCDLEVAEERKFVKEQASSIKGLLKKVNTARIAKTKDYRFNVEQEAKLITARLEAANKPFTDLLDAYQIKRNKELAAKKASEEAEELRVEIVRCHDEAFNIDKLMMFEQKQRADELEAKYKANWEEAGERARLKEVKRQEDEARFNEKKRVSAESDKKLRAKIHKEIKERLMKDCGIDEETAVKVVKSMIKIERVTIHYL